MAIENRALTDGQVGYPDEESDLDTINQVHTPDDNGDVTVEFISEEDLLSQEVEQALLETDHYANLADILPDKVLDDISSELISKVETDNEQRAEWLTILKDGIKLLGLKHEKLSEPFEGACSATHPLLIEAVTKFQAKAFSELFPSNGPVKSKILGSETEPRRAQAQRVKDFMNFEVMDMMPEYGPELDRLLLYCGFAGSAFKKTWYERTLERPSTQFINAEDLIVPYHATNLDTCERYTHKISMSMNEILKNQLVGTFRNVEIEEAADPEVNEAKQSIDDIEGKESSENIDDIHTLYEIHCNYNIPQFGHLDADGLETGIALPYIITLDKDSGTILSIYRNWREEDKLFRKRMYVTHYQFIPGLGFYGYGYLHLVGSLARTATSSLRQLTDAGTFSNLPAGFKAHGVRVVGDGGPIQPGEFRDINAPLADITKSIMPLPFKEPSATLFNLLQFMVTAGEKFADSTEQLVSEARTYGPVGTVMALLEQGGKLFSAIHKRLHAAQGRDFKILHDLNYEWMPPEYPYEVAGGANKAFRDDFGGRIAVVPVSDPNMPTQAHRIAKSNAIFSIAVQAPQEHNMREILMRVYDAMNEPDIEKILKPLPQQVQPADLITENQNTLLGQPIRSGVEQNHPAHIRGHFAFLQLPAIQQNEIAASSMIAHIHEHIAMDYRIRIEQILGQQLPPPGQPLPPEIEEQISIAAAKATEQMLKDDMMNKVMSDPSIQVAMRGLDIEEKKVDKKFETDLMNIGLKREEMIRDDENEDLDRLVDIKKVNIQASATRNKNSGKK